MLHALRRSALVPFCWLSCATLEFAGALIHMAGRRFRLPSFPGWEQAWLDDASRHAADITCSFALEEVALLTMHPVREVDLSQSDLEPQQGKPGESMGVPQNRGTSKMGGPVMSCLKLAQFLSQSARVAANQDLYRAMTAAQAS